MYGQKPDSQPHGKPADGPGQSHPLDKAREIYAKHLEQKATQDERQRQIETAINSLIATDLKGCGTIPRPPELEKWLKETGAKHFVVICHEPGKPDEGIGFLLLSDFLPPVGGILLAPDGRAAVVRRVQFPIMGYGPPNALPEVLAATPNVMAEFALDLTEAPASE